MPVYFVLLEESKFEMEFAFSVNSRINRIFFYRILFFMNSLYLYINISQTKSIKTIESKLQLLLLEFGVSDSKLQLLLLEFGVMGSKLQTIGVWCHWKQINL